MLYFHHSIVSNNCDRNNIINNNYTEWVLKLLISLTV